MIGKKRSRPTAVNLGPDALRSDLLSLEFVATAASGSDLTTYTFAGVSLGAAAPSRIVVATVGWGDGSGTTATLVSVTIGGQSATIAATYVNNGNRSGTAIVYAAVPSGATGDVVVTLDSGAVNCGVSVWTSYNALTVLDTDGAPSSVSVTGESATLVCGHWGVYGAWTGLTPAFARNTESTWHHAGGLVTTSGAVTVSNAGATYPSMVAVAFGTP